MNRVIIRRVISLSLLAGISCGFFQIKSQTPEEIFLSDSGDNVRGAPAYSRLLGYAHNVLAFERAKIDFLIDRTKRSPYTFIRDGVEYSGKRAAAHLIWKYHRKVSLVQSAGAFVDNVATRSGLSGELYLLKVQGLSYPFRDVLLNELRRLELLLKEDHAGTDKRGIDNAQASP